MNEELKNEMRATINASIPALAVYSGETEQIIRDITHYSVTNGLHQQTGLATKSVPSDRSQTKLLCGDKFTARPRYGRRSEGRLETLLKTS